MNDPASPANLLSRLDWDDLRFVLAAVTLDFITRHKDRPFFLYLAHAMPGSTTKPFASEAFRGKSANGPYGDSVEEIDWSTGEILAALKRSLGTCARVASSC